MQELNKIVVIPKSGEEQFSLNGKRQDFKLSEFWSWSQSDLLNNTLRGVLAEFIVKKALSIDSQVKIEWNAYDLETKEGIKLEIKSSAYLQSWKQDQFSKISFDISPTNGWDAKTNTYSNIVKRQSDYYIFCLLHHQEKETVNPLALEQWTFYILKTSILDEKKKEQKRISLGSLLKLSPKTCNFDELRNWIK